jgi:hypothetical protein
MVEVYFDGVLVDNPVEWEELSVSITFDHVNQVTLIEYDTSLTFYGSGNDYLYSRKDDSCQMIPVVIKKICNGTSDNIINGNILITDCVFDELECSTTVTIQDDGYSSRIQNNKSTNVSMSVTETKNGLALTPAQERLVTMFTPSTGGYSGKVRGYTVFEVFRVLVAWMSDNTVDFASDYFETGDGSNDWMCSGVDLRNLSDSNDIQRINPVSTSFEELYSTHRKIQNLALGFQRVNNRPVLRIEPLSYFRDNTVILNLANVNKTELSYVQEILYAAIKIGSQIIRPSECDSGNTNCSAANNISYYGFDEEEYSITGECNKDIKLDLSISDGFVIDTSTIEDVIIYDNDSYDKENFIINIFENTPSAWRAVQTDVFGIGAYWYNERYTNKSILERYISYIVGNLLLFGLYDGLNLFMAESNVASGGTFLLPDQTPNYQYQTINLVTEQYDPFNRFDLLTDRFTPVDEGVYQFSMGINVDDFPSCPSGIFVEYALCVEIYDSSNVFIDRYESDTRNHTTRLSSPEFEEWVSPYIPMDADNYAIFTVRYSQGNNPAAPPFQAQLVLGGDNGGTRPTYFGCVNSRVVIQDIQANTGENRRVAKTSFDYPIAFEDFKQYINDTTKLIGVSNQRINRVGWNNEIKYNFNTGDANVSILSNDA